ncbi:hypothetical protein BH10PAT4_BH10PAT4_5480 [soil metagenome]
MATKFLGPKHDLGRLPEPPNQKLLESSYEDTDTVGLNESLVNTETASGTMPLETQKKFQENRLKRLTDELEATTDVSDRTLIKEEIAHAEQQLMIIKGQETRQKGASIAIRASQTNVDA